jgi:hypothetical protein
MQKLTRSYLRNKLGLVIHLCSLSYLGDRDRRITV